jgi:hypothetical protein
MRRIRDASLNQVLISLFIVSIIGLHAVPLVLHKGRSQTSWPFLMWSMYKDSRSAGPIEARDTRLIGVTSSGSTEFLTAFQIGLPRPTVRELYLKRMLASDSAAAQRLFDRLNANRPEPFVEIRVMSIIYGLTDSGIVHRNNPVLTFRAGTSHLN